MVRDFTEPYRAAAARTGRCLAPRSAWITAGLIILLGHVLAWLADSRPYFMLGDSIGYLQTMLEPVPSLKAPLGYALALALPLLVVRDLQMIVLVQVLAAIGTGALAAWIVRTAVERSEAPVAGNGLHGNVLSALPVVTFVVVSLWPRHVYYAHTVLSECLATFWIGCVAALLLATRRRPRDMFLLGVTFACATLTRSASVALLPGVLAVMQLAPRGVGRIRAVMLLAAGASALLVPYATANRVLRGGFTLTAFDGWTLFGTVGSLVDVDAIEDPLVRDIFTERRVALETLSPSSLRWSPRSPAVALHDRYRASYVDLDAREMVRRDGLASALEAMWRHGEHPEIRTNRVLRDVALRAIRDHPDAYARSALARFAAYWLGRDRYRVHFQSLDGTGSEERNFRLPKLRTLLRSRFGTDVPASGSGVLLGLRYVAYDLRLALLVPVAWAFGIILRRRMWNEAARTLVGLACLALSLSLGTAAVAEIYDRYTAVTDGLLLTMAFVAVATIARRGRSSSRGVPIGGDRRAP